MAKVFVVLVSLLMTLFTSLDVEGQPVEYIDCDSIALDEIEFRSDSLVLKIMNDVVSEGKPSEEGRLYLLSLSDFSDTTKAYVSLEEDSMIARSKNFVGYVMIGRDTVIVTGDHVKDFTYTDNPRPIKLRLKDGYKQDFPEWWYIIKDGLLARDGGTMGWIWYIPNAELRKYNLTKYTVTAPKRTKR